MDKKNKELTTPPPASQERGDSRICYVCGHRGDEHPIEPHPRGGTRRGKCPASPSSSAAEDVPDFWVREDSLAAMAEDYVCGAAEQAKLVAINPVEIDSKLIPDSAEGAKPEDLETWRRGITERLLVATEKLADKAEQAQAGELPDRNPSLANEQQGLYRKFDVRRTDGSDQPGGKHHGCEYFVLDVNHDKHAQAALNAYQASVAKTHPQLARDMRDRYGLQPDASIEEIEGYAKGLESRDMFAEAALLRRLADGVTPEMVRRLAIRLCEDEGIEPHELLWQGSPAQPKGEMWCEYTACARDYLISALGAK